MVTVKLHDTNSSALQNRQVGVENIQKTVADFYKIKVAGMYSKKRRRAAIDPDRNSGARLPNGIVFVDEHMLGIAL